MKDLMKLMFGHPMEEAGEPGGGSTPATTTPPTATEGTPPADGNPAPTGGQGEPPKTPAEAATGEPKPFLGTQPEKPTEGAEAPKEGEQPPTAPDEKAYLDAVKANKDVLGKDNDLEFDQALVKSVIPVCQKHNISVEAANEMANAFAKAQLDAAKTALQERCDRFQKMNTEARAKYNDKDFEQINRGIDKFFKPGGAMNFTIRNSELGADPEFLALMHHLGAAERIDTVEGAASGSGSPGGDGSSFSGISKLW